MMKLLLAFVALCILYVRAQNGEPDEPARCGNYWDITVKYARCIGDGLHQQHQDYSVDIIYTNAKLLCKKRPEIMECMREAFGNCSNNHELFTITDNEFNFCELLEVDQVMTTFFENNAGSRVRRPCIRAVMVEVREKYGRPQFDDAVYRMKGPTSLETLLSRQKRYFTWYISKFMLADLDETLEVCDGMTRRTVFGIMISCVDVESSWGLDLYKEFTNMVEEDIDIFNLPA